MTDPWVPKKMSADQQAEFLAAHRRGENPDPRDYLGNARADAARKPGDDRLIKRTTFDAANRPIHTYVPAVAGQRKIWMDQFKAVGFVQIRINNSSATQTPEMKAQALAAFRLSHPDLKV